MPTGQALLDQIERTPVIPNSLVIWGLGQMGIMIKGPDGLLVIDPCLSDIVREVSGDWWIRAFPPTLQPEQLARANYILTTHDHLDHLDAQTVGPAVKASPTLKVVATGWSHDTLAGAGIGEDRYIMPKAFEPFTLPGLSARITALPSAHYEKEFDTQKGWRWFGYVIEWNGVTLYHSGDTIIYDGYEAILREQPPVDIAMLAVNGRDWYREADAQAIGNLWPREAARLASDMGWSMVITGHNDMYPNNTIPMHQIAQGFEQFAPRQPYKILQPGELYYFVK